jgi:hypothetical protein
MTIFGIEGTDQLLAHWDNVIAGKIDDHNFGGHSTCETYWAKTRRSCIILPDARPL